MPSCLVLFLLGLVFTELSSCSLNDEAELHSIHPDRILSLQRRADGGSNESFAITGIQVSGFAPQERLEIRQLEKNTDAWNIYLLGSVYNGVVHHENSFPFLSWTFELAQISLRCNTHAHS